jgi:hypothetical protein
MLKLLISSMRPAHWIKNLISDYICWVTFLSKPVRFSPLSQGTGGIHPLLSNLRRRLYY